MGSLRQRLRGHHRPRGGPGAGRAPVPRALGDGRPFPRRAAPRGGAPHRGRASRPQAGHAGRPDQPAQPPAVRSRAGRGVASPPRHEGVACRRCCSISTASSPVNDVYGHAPATRCSSTSPPRLQQAVRQGDLVARFGGDEFAMLSRHVSGAEDAPTSRFASCRSCARRSRRGPPASDRRRHRHRARSAGWNAARRAAAQGRCRALPREGGAAARACASSSRRWTRTCASATAWSAGFARRSRPARSCRTISRSSICAPTKVVGFEALARWTHPELGEMPPDRFHADRRARGLAASSPARSCARPARTPWPGRRT